LNIIINNRGALAVVLAGVERWRGAILHNELIVIFLHYNGSLCNLALGGFRLLSVGCNLLFLLTYQIFNKKES
jgi:hypothetical protein